ncbi:MAG: diguanylate cyclase [Sphaerochaeta sp.]|nr:diguanylate cyclase [Sphaerochaeta sp.]
MKIQLCLGCILSVNDISIALFTFYKEWGDDWLSYVLDIFYTECNNFCMFFDIIGSSIGVALFPKDGSRVKDLMAASDKAMYQAKTNKDLLFVRYRQGM